ncbi:hypothetical protein B484DRAFT_398183 [Ochromonadaceae sp. CCMP2298]|nr:hypothetical protein B484DRAFT_398183 [Ochromonadaceae sp. CCMP2298]
MEQPNLVGEGDSDDEQEAPWPPAFGQANHLTGARARYARVIFRYRLFIVVPEEQVLLPENMTDELMSGFPTWFCYGFGLATQPLRSQARVNMVIAALKGELRRLLMPALQQGGFYPMFQMAVQAVRAADPNPW